LLDFDPQKFWENVNKISNGKASAHVTSLGGVSGQHNITDVWKNHFEKQKLYNSKSDSKHRVNFERKLLEKLPTVSNPVITVADVSYALAVKNVGRQQVQMDSLWRPSCLLGTVCMFC